MTWHDKSLKEQLSVTHPHLCLVGITAYDSVNHDALIAILKNYMVLSHLVNIINEMYTNTGCQIRTTEGASEEFSAEGLFMTSREKTMYHRHPEHPIYRQPYPSAKSTSELQVKVNALHRACTRWDMTSNSTKTKTMTVGEDDEDHPMITMRGSLLEVVESFSYLGSELGKNAKVDGDVWIRLDKASRVYQKWGKEVFWSRNVSKKTKVHVLAIMVMFMLLYRAETWAVTQ